MGWGWLLPMLVSPRQLFKFPHARELMSLSQFSNRLGWSKGIRWKLWEKGEDVANHIPYSEWLDINLFNTKFSRNMGIKGIKDCCHLWCPYCICLISSLSLIKLGFFIGIHLRIGIKRTEWTSFGSFLYTFQNECTFLIGSPVFIVYHLRNFQKFHFNLQQSKPKIEV